VWENISVFMGKGKKRPNPKWRLDRSTRGSCGIGERESKPCGGGGKPFFLTWAAKNESMTKSRRDKPGGMWTPMLSASYISTGQQKKGKHGSGDGRMERGVGNSACGGTHKGRIFS